MRGVYHRGVALFFLRGRVHHSGVTFFLFSGRICDRRFLLFTSRQECQADKQTNIFSHTKESRLGTDLVAFDRIPNLVERRIY